MNSNNSLNTAKPPRLRVGLKEVDKEVFGRSLHQAMAGEQLEATLRRVLREEMQLHPAA